ncbi:MAG: hypothetical protein EAZ21_15605 [Betaproteobacteria bacterium]|nr:MAG: hypothetical protein EAZ21_15605 [Betaproteobacteria bacterium]
MSYAGVLGLLGGFWISLLAAVFLLGHVNKFVPVDGFVVVLFGVIGAFVGRLIGRRWPKISKIVFLPFAFFGFTS